MKLKLFSPPAEQVVYFITIQIKKHRKYGAFRAGDERIELPLKVLETSVIPFDQSPVCCSPNTYNTNTGNCQQIFDNFQ